ncbi:MAG: hypothetical protein R3E34_13455 [Rhodocyclaceae bacterium]
MSFREHNEFHEQCVERMFCDLMARCAPQRLEVWARYTRRGGLDINPWRSSVAGAAQPGRSAPMGRVNVLPAPPVEGMAFERRNREAAMLAVYGRGGLSATLVLPVPVLADPPAHAPAHGWRKKHDPDYIGYTGRKWERDYGILDGRCSTEAVGAVVGGVIGGHLLKSNCLVTGQPDWATVYVNYTGAPIDRAGLLRYIVSFREHNEFHEQCVERMFCDLMARCAPARLEVWARYTRRGGLDINPWRSSVTGAPPLNQGDPRQ